MKSKYLTLFIGIVLFACEFENINPTPRDVMNGDKDVINDAIGEDARSVDVDCRNDSSILLQWYYTCGDPVCRGYTGPFTEIPLCTEMEKEGAACSEKGKLCDPQDSCNRKRMCTDTNPAVMCPISSKKHKKDINYLTEEEMERYYQELKQFRLATYRYSGAHDSRPHLGIMVEDNEKSIAVDETNEGIDLYSYTSLSIVAIQQQAKLIDHLREEIAELRHQNEALFKELESLKALIHPRKSLGK